MGGEEIAIAVLLHKIAEKPVPLSSGTVFEITPFQSAAMAVAYQAVQTGEVFGTVSFGIAGRSRMVVDVGDIKIDAVFEKEMKEGG